MDLVFKYQTISLDGLETESVIMCTLRMLVIYVVVPKSPNRFHIGEGGPS